MSDTIEISRANAIEAYEAADPATKTVLENLIGVDNLQPDPITETVTDFEDAWEIFSELSFTDLIYSRLKAGNADEFLSIDKLLVIAKVLQEDFEPDYKNPDQKKWFPIFRMDSETNLFVCAGSSSSEVNTINGMGARFAMPTEIVSDYLGNQFIALWNQFLLDEQAGS